MKRLKTERRSGVAHGFSRGGHEPTPCSSPPPLKRWATRLAATVLACVAGCPMSSDEVSEINPFRDLPAIAIDGVSRDLTATVVPIGSLEEGQVVRVLVESDTVESVLILAEDEAFDEAGVIVGGGPVNEAFDHRAAEAGRYFVFTQGVEDVPSSTLTARITLSAGDEAYRPPATQRVVISFEPSFLSDPGLFDPESGTADERAFLEQISDQVSDGIVARLRTVFDGTPIEVFDERDGLPDAPFSRVTISPERVVDDSADFVLDSAAPVGFDAQECPDRVIFGEVLPAGSTLDVGNRMRDDAAIVYAGSFQGRGEACQTAVVNSVNTVILGLSQTAAHEIGHLVGLRHVALVDIMDRSPSQAFQRELAFQRGQILTEKRVRLSDGTLSDTTLVLTIVYQDPSVYFGSVFGGG